MLEAGQKAGKSSIGFSVHADIFAGASQHPSPLQSTLPVEKTRNRTAVKKDVKDYSRLTRPKSWCGKPLRRIPCQLKASDKKDHESWVIKFQNYCPWSRCSPLSQEHCKKNRCGQPPSSSGDEAYKMPRNLIWLTCLCCPLSHSWWSWFRGKQKLLAWARPYASSR